jgi:hypothetical protein
MASFLTEAQRATLAAALAAKQQAGAFPFDHSLARELWVSPGCAWPVDWLPVAHFCCCCRG